MTERKSLRDISWNVDEPTYRSDTALSYSTLARFEREGFNGLSRLFDKIESPSLLFGSIVDCLITGTDEEFNNTYMVTEMGSPISDTLISITKTLFNKFHHIYTSINDISDDALIETISDISWNNHWLPRTRAKKIKEDCAAYYKLMYLAGNRVIISNSLYNEAIKTVDALKSSDSTRFYFEQDNMFNNRIERLYQLKFKSRFEEIDYRCMADLIIVLHDKKLIVPVDLKTSSKPEWDFPKSFIDWSYFMQARLYWRIIRDNMDKDPYFKDFELANYKFIVVNKKTLTPLVWDFESTKKLGDLKLGENIYRDPFTIGKELKGYLDNTPTVPNGINLVKPNKIESWI